VPTTAETARSPRAEALRDELVELFLAEGFSRFGVGDLATRLHCSRTTLYQVAESKEQLVRSAVRRYFRRAAERIEARVAAEPDPGARLEVYLAGVAEELAPASDAFYTDVAAHPAARGAYEDNTRAAARRVEQLVAEAVAAGRMRQVDVHFVGAAVAELMTAIQAGRIRTERGRDDAAAYRALADLVERGLSADTVPR
jgi:AcrR family transcriptional regulator